MRKLDARQNSAAGVTFSLSFPSAMPVEQDRPTSARVVPRLQEQQ
jgi:hypothetical protein